MARLHDHGAWIDRSSTIRFTFNGREYRGHKGDTLASALLANDVQLVARSFKYHRPRGILGLGEEEPNALVQLEPDGPYTAPNCKATRVALYEGLSATSQNCWPSVEYDLGALAWSLHRFLPGGFYYKTFKWPRWETFEPYIRRAAGLGRAPHRADPARYLKRHAHCEVLVVGGGPAGLAAAQAAADTGARVLLAHAQSRFGGSTTGRNDLTFEGLAIDDWTNRAVARLQTCANVTLLADTTVLGQYDHGMFIAVEQTGEGCHPSELGVRPSQRIWHVRSERVVFATGAHERPMVFPDNDRPGVMLASAVAGYALRYGVAPGRRVLMVVSDDRAYRTARVLLDAGIKVVALLDTRRETPSEPLAAPLHSREVALHCNARVAAVMGTRGVRAVRFRSQRSPSGERLECDLVAMSGGWTPAVQLFAQGAGALRFDATLNTFVPQASNAQSACIGAAAGLFGLDEAIDQARRAGGHSRPVFDMPFAKVATAADSASKGSDEEGSPWWTSDQPADRQWIDFQSDVTVSDVLLAAHERFVSVEHLKRYTTIGMSTDQGKTSNVNALAILGEATDRSPGAVGTTRFRPPYVPVTMAAVAAGAHGDLLTPRRKLPAHSAHLAAGAVFEDFGSWQRPDHYPRAGETRDEAIQREQRALRTSVALFDASPIGKIEITGADSARFLDFIYANRIDTLAPGRIRYGLMLNENAVVFDDGVCGRTDAASFLLSPSSGAAQRVVAWLEEWRQCEFAKWDVNILDVTSAWACIAVSGPAARDVLGRVRTDIDLASDAFPHMAIREGTFGGVCCRILRVSFSGELQYEVQVPAAYGESLWTALSRAGEPERITPVGIEAWLRLRIEKGYLHVGTDTDGTTLPGDIGFGGAIARKPGDFVGRRSLARTDAQRTDREQLVGVVPVDATRVIPVGACLIASGTLVPQRPHKYERSNVLKQQQILAPAVREGRVTSSCFSPVLGKAIALGLLRGGRARHGEQLDAFHDGQTMAVRIVEPIYYDREGARLDG